MLESRISVFLIMWNLDLRRVNGSFCGKEESLGSFLVLEVFVDLFWID